MTVFLRSTSEAAVAGVKSLVYGPAGVGKTRLLATAPYPVIFSAEAGLLSLRQYNLPFFEIKTFADLQEAYNWAKGSIEAQQFWTVCLDSISEVGEVVLKSEMARNKDGRKAYGEYSIKLIEIVRDFRNLPGKHVIITAKQEWAKDDATGLMIFQPNMPGQKVGPALPYFFDEVFQYCVFRNPQTGQLTQWLRTRRDQQNEAKDRSGSLAEYEPPNLADIFGKIINGKA